MLMVTPFKLLILKPLDVFCSPSTTFLFRRSSGGGFGVGSRLCSGFGSGLLPDTGRRLSAGLFNSRFLPGVFVVVPCLVNFRDVYLLPFLWRWCVGFRSFGSPWLCFGAGGRGGFLSLLRFDHRFGFTFLNGRFGH